MIDHAIGLNDNSYNAYSVINDTIYGVSLDSIFPRYHLNLGRYKLPVSRVSNKSAKQARKLYLNDGYRRDQRFLLLTYVYGKGGGIVSSISKQGGCEELEPIF